MSARFHRSLREQRLVQQRRDAWRAREEVSWRRGYMSTRYRSLEEWAGNFLLLGIWRKRRPFECRHGKNCRVCQGAKYQPAWARLPVRDRRKLSGD